MQMNNVFKPDQAHNLYIQPSSYRHVMPYYSSNPVTPLPQPFQPYALMLIKSCLTGFATFPIVKKARARAPGDLSSQLPASAKPRKTFLVSKSWKTPIVVVKR